MIVLVCGSRTWDDAERVREVLRTLPSNAVIVHGGAQGADQMAGALAARRGLHVAEVRALWTLNGKAAGPLRNAAMLRLRPQVVIAFWDGKSRGTRNMIDLAESAGIPVEVHSLIRR